MVSGVRPPTLVNVVYTTTPRSLRKSQNQTVRQHLDSFAEILDSCAAGENFNIPDCRSIDFCNRKLDFSTIQSTKISACGSGWQPDFQSLCHTTLSQFNTSTIIIQNNSAIPAVVLEDLGSGLAFDSLEQSIALLKNIELKKLWCLTQQCARAFYA